MPSHSKEVSTFADFVLLEHLKTVVQDFILHPQLFVVTLRLVNSVAPRTFSIETWLQFSVSKTFKLADILSSLRSPLFIYLPAYADIVHCAFYCPYNA